MSKSNALRQSARDFWHGSHTVPRTRWTAASKWRPSLSTFLILNFGLYLFGTGEALFVQAGLGNGPWTVFSQGVSKRTGLPLGLSTLLISAVVLLLWVPLKQRPGLGTIANMIVIAGALQIGITVIPPAHELWLSVLMVLAGIVGIGAASGLYLTCGLGPGPRDGWMTAIHFKTGIPVARVRMAIEVLVLTIGWLLGGVVGFGTLAFAFLIGRSLAIWLGFVAKFAHTSQSLSDLDEIAELEG
ncbi:hypothetical protein GALL_426790 [mine drainage metagenome]|uniref:Membrane protein containing DUF161 n=1 Tax=mine drainage metagenome TaxID=410659 RepID=A0A1J5Q707_9ZZZZ